MVVKRLINASTGSYVKRRYWILPIFGVLQCVYSNDAATRTSGDPRLPLFRPTRRIRVLFANGLVG